MTVRISLALLLALGASAPLTGPLSITAFAPEIMLSVVIALTMDFALAGAELAGAESGCAGSAESQAWKY